MDRAGGSSCPPACSAFAPVILAGLILLSEWCMPRSLNGLEETALTLPLVILYIALAYNNSYHDYFADLASPATIGFLAIVCFLGVIIATWKQQWGWLLLFAMIANFDRPTIIMFLALLFGAIAVLWLKEGIRTLVVLAITGISCLVLTYAHEQLYVPLQGLELWDSGSGWVGVYATLRSRYRAISVSSDSLRPGSCCRHVANAQPGSLYPRAHFGDYWLLWFLLYSGLCSFASFCARNDPPDYRSLAYTSPTKTSTNNNGIYHRDRRHLFVAILSAVVCHRPNLPGYRPSH